MAYLERSELDGGITLKKMKEVAEAMHCRFVYAIVPAGGKDESIEMIIEQQAETIAVQNLDIFRQQLSTH